METIKADSKGLELDGIHMMVPRELMLPEARKKRDTYAITPGLPFIQCEFGFYSLEAWAEQGMPQGVSHQELFGFEPSGGQGLGGLGWCEAAFHPCFEEKLIQDRGDLEVVQDAHGRHVLCFKGRRNGFMPEYLDHPVKDMKTWEENCKILEIIIKICQSANTLPFRHVPFLHARVPRVPRAPSSPSSRRRL